MYIYIYIEVYILKKLRLPPGLGSRIWSLGRLAPFGPSKPPNLTQIFQNGIQKVLWESFWPSWRVILNGFGGDLNGLGGDPQWIVG